MVTHLRTCNDCGDCHMTIALSVILALASVVLVWLTIHRGIRVHQIRGRRDKPLIPIEPCTECGKQPRLRVDRLRFWNIPNLGFILSCCGRGYRRWQYGAHIDPEGMRDEVAALWNNRSRGKLP